jgi:hypothetical protein
VIFVSTVLTRGEELLELKAKADKFAALHFRAGAGHRTDLGLGEIDQVQAHALEAQLQVGGVGGLDAAGGHPPALVHGLVLHQRHGRLSRYPR